MAETPEKVFTKFSAGRVHPHLSSNFSVGFTVLSFVAPDRVGKFNLLKPSGHFTYHQV
jgi:hypothetical protein